MHSLSSVDSLALRSAKVRPWNECKDASLLSLGRSPAANESKRLVRAYCQYAANYERRTDSAHNKTD